MSENVVDGLSAWYALARLRPMDITLPIWPAARRCIQTKKPMISTIGSSSPAQFNSQLDYGWLNLMLTFFSLSVASSASLTPRSPAPVAVNFVAVRGGAVDRAGALVDRDALDVAGVDLGHELE